MTEHEAAEATINLPDLSDDTLWTTDQVARYLAMSKSWVYQNAADGTLPSLNIGGARRFDPTEIKAWARGEGPRAKVLPIVGRTK